MSQKQSVNLVVFMPFIFLFPFILIGVMLIASVIAVVKGISQQSSTKVEAGNIYTQLPVIFQEDEETNNDGTPETGATENMGNPLTPGEVEQVLKELSKRFDTNKPIRSAGRAICSQLGLKPGNRASLQAFTNYLVAHNLKRDVWNEVTRQLVH